MTRSKPTWALAVLMCCLPGLLAAESTARKAIDPPPDLERGRWLVEGILRCYTCHSPLDADAPGMPIVEGMKGAGRVYSEKPGRRNVARNITPDEETGIGRWSDETLARVIREGIGHDGRALSLAMPAGYFRDLSDADLASVIAYLRQQPAVVNALPPTLLPDDEQARLKAERQQLDGPVDSVESTDTIAYGRYLTKIGQCTGCHTAWEAPRMPGLLAGGNAVDGGYLKEPVFSANITPHATGIAYSKQTFIAVMREGKGGTLHGIMPWQAYRHVPERELAAQYDYLHTLHPFSHLISNAVAPSQCAVCGQAHGLGAQNQIELPQPAAVDPVRHARYAGTYVFQPWDLTVEILLQDDTLHIREDQRPPVALIALSRDRFLYEGAVAPIRFRSDERGRVTAIVSEEVDEVVLERVLTSDPETTD